MKEDKDNIFEKQKQALQQLDGNLHILEHRIPVEKQMEYFKYSDYVRKEQTPITEEDLEYYNIALYNDETTLEYKKHILSLLATSRFIRAFRILEKYVKHPDPEVADWANLALLEIRMSLESELSEEKQVFISTGLGGKDHKLRFYALLLSTDRKPFVDYQKETIQREFSFFVPQIDGEVERLHIGENYVEITFLTPMGSNIKELIDRIVNECNQYGNFIHDIYTVTNVRELSEEEVLQIVNASSKDKNESDEPIDSTPL